MVETAGVDGNADMGVVGTELGGKVAAGTGAGDEDPKRLRMSSTVDFCCWEGAEPVAVVFEEPKISARRSWLDCGVAGCATLDPVPGVTEMSSPRRSP